MRSPLRLLGALPAVAALGALLAACGPSSAAAPEPTAYAAAGRPQLPTAHGPSDTIVYNPYTQRLIRYDEATTTPEPPAPRPNWFQYEFPTPSDLYTSGSSTENGFSVIKLDRAGTSTVLTMAADEGVFPLATDGRTHFFLVSRYGTDGRELSRQVAMLTRGNTLTRYEHATGLIDSGALLDGRLHYTVLDERTQTYSLHSVSATDPADRPRTVRSGLRGGKVLAHDGALWTSDGERLTNGAAALPCPDLCYFVGNRLLVLRVGSSNGLALDLHDPRTATLVQTVEDVVAFRPQGRQLRVFGENYVKDVDLGLAP